MIMHDIFYWLTVGSWIFAAIMWVIWIVYTIKYF